MERSKRSLSGAVQFTPHTHTSPSASEHVNSMSAEFKIFYLGLPDSKCDVKITISKLKRKFILRNIDQRALPYA